MKLLAKDDDVLLFLPDMSFRRGSTCHFFWTPTSSFITFDLLCTLRDFAPC